MNQMFERRDFLRGASSGFGTMALAMMLQEDANAERAVKISDAFSVILCKNFVDVVDSEKIAKDNLW